MEAVCGVYINETPGFLHEVDRSHLFDCVLRLYNTQASLIVLEFSLCIKFTGELGVDEGGIQRDMFSAFCMKECYSMLFEGSITVVPMVYPQIDMSQYTTISSAWFQKYY